MLTRSTSFDRGRGFVRRHTRLRRLAFIPEIQLYLADEVEPVWRAAQSEWDGESSEPPYWEVAWPGGQALARYLLDHPEEAEGRSVVDIATGSGLCAVAAMKSGARSALAGDVDPLCAAAVCLNAGANGVTVRYLQAELLDSRISPSDLVIVGDIFYDRHMADDLLPKLQAAARRGTRVIVGDPGRTYFPYEAFDLLAEHDVPASVDVEAVEVKRSGVYRLRP